ncbi:ankyrin repeat domain-containing protein [Endozoicomonas sp. GU-1]|uniref:ankyrin repeat domain-containing protein n=1 Tax=Endozoicomonas sp. GU-1 TaxID=3009078 RepID=UPI0022B379B2|nr:ankyrin repeat domain-containing protein [Endozoicomonas sp. GU-1]WBA82966.1 ankyrin repeat domain-containing protein [Endozoicomonas sp. GU-1]WBA85892.1 ankyrin repeat domain-containing protein [Endozoicomonas sp. GU-1]
MNPYRDICSDIAPDLQSMSFGSGQSQAPANGNVNGVSALPDVMPAIEPGRVLLTRRLCVDLESHKVVKLEQIQKFLSNGVDLNTQISAGDLRDCNPLHSAAISGNGEAVAAIIATGQVTDINVVDGNGFTPLALLCGARVEKAKFVCRFASEPEEHKARLLGLEALLGAGANQHTADRNGCQPVHHAARYNFPGLIKRMAEQGGAGIDGTDRSTDIINSRDRHGNTPLHIAAGNNGLGAAETLLTLGADVMALNKSGQTPLHRLCMSKKNNNVFGGMIACLLLEHGVNGNQRDKKEFTWLEYAGKNSMDKLLEYVVSKHNSVLPDQKSKIAVAVASRCNVNTGRKSAITVAQSEEMISLLRSMPDTQASSLRDICKGSIRDTLVQNQRDLGCPRDQITDRTNEAVLLLPLMPMGKLDMQNDENFFE